MPNFAYVRDGVVKYVQSTPGATPAEEKWIALNRSGVVLKDSTHYDVMPGDLLIDDKFYKKDIETGETTLLEDGAWTHPRAIRFAGIMDGEVVGQWGLGKENFEDEAEINQFVEDILASQVVELPLGMKLLVKKGWLYDGVDFSEPSND